MSIRRAPASTNGTAGNANQLRADIDNLRAAVAMQAQQTPEAIAMSETAALFESLSETEKSAAMLGANPDELKPIGWINAAHYTTLLKKNALDSNLTQGIEAYKVITTPQ